jgi:hypothetical protein
MGAMDLQHIQYRELGKCLQVLPGESVWRKIVRERTAPAPQVHPEAQMRTSEGGRYKSWCNKGTERLKDSCGARQKR